MHIRLETAQPCPADRQARTALVRQLPQRALNLPQVAGTVVAVPLRCFRPALEELGELLRRPVQDAGLQGAGARGPVLFPCGDEFLPTGTRTSRLETLMLAA